MALPTSSASESPSASVSLVKALLMILYASEGRAEQIFLKVK
jgi:hypothetical protein